MIVAIVFMTKSDGVAVSSFWFQGSRAVMKRFPTLKIFDVIKKEILCLPPLLLLFFMRF